MAPSSAPSDTITTITASTQITIPLHPKKPSYATLNPKSTPHEFLGPPGALAVCVLTPVISYLLWFGCNERSGCPPPLDQWFAGLSTWTGEGAGRSGWEGLVGRAFDLEAMGAYLLWYTYTVACWWVLPGEWVEGTLLRDGTKQAYKINGMSKPTEALQTPWCLLLVDAAAPQGLSTLCLTLGLTFGLLLSPTGPERMTYLYDHWIGILTASLLMAIVQATWVWWWSFKSGELLALGGNSGVFIYDFFIGRPLNPMLPKTSFIPETLTLLDIKSFNELRPGMILWMLLLISCACEQSLRNGGGLKGVDGSMWLVLIGQGYYILDSVLNETAMLTMMDITSDGFGFMLAIGDLTWVPFTYSLQARYLAFHPTKFDTPGLAAIIALGLTGFWIFRISNKEKNDFRNGRNPKNLKFMETASGSKLLTSGWWGRSRHPNYFGDWLMAWAWCLPTGFETPIPYFYVVYFAVLLVHRQRRDDEACRKKYGTDWDKYCELVPYRIIPYVY